jgi:hypothetical protein
MRNELAEETNAELKALVTEACCALALLDVRRLEQLAACCEALNRRLETEEMDAEFRLKMTREAQAAAPGMAVFSRVLEATRANLAVMQRLREMRLGQLEYQAKPVAWAEAQTERGDGND